MNQCEDYPVDNRGFASSKVAAPYAHTTEGTMSVWRHKGVGPRWIKRGRQVYYSYAELDRWMLSQPVFRSTAEYPGNARVA
jgi:hypothetical protein